MNPLQTGNLIRTLRQRRGLTQKTLAEQIGVSDKAVSKWERGCGLPDPALLSSLAEVLNTDADALLRGELPLNRRASGKLKRCAFCVCPACNNLILSTDGARPLLRQAFGTAQAAAGKFRSRTKATPHK